MKKYYANDTFSGEVQAFEMSELRIPIDKYQYLQNEIQSFTELERNWDGYSAIPLIKEIGESANKLITMLGGVYIDRVSDIFPNAHGTITIEWENRKKDKMSLEIGVSNYSYFVRRQDKKPKLVNGLDVFEDFKTLTSDLEDLFSEEAPKYFLP